jgi:hypothetical protein
MAITFACSGCRKDYRVPDEFAGRTTKCRQCGADLQIPSPQVAVQLPPAVTMPPPPLMAAPAAAVPRAPAALPAEPLAPAARPSFPARLKVAGAGGGLLIAGLLLFCAETAMVRALFSSSPAPMDGVRYLPDKCMIVAGVKVDDLLDSDAWKEVEKELPNFRDDSNKVGDEIGVPLANISYILRGQAKGPPHDPITVVTTKKSVNARDMLDRIKKTKYDELNMAGRTVYQRKYADNILILPEQRVAFCVVDSKTVIMGTTHQVRSVLERDKKPELSVTLQAALKQADTSRTAFVAIDFKDVNPGRWLDLPNSFQLPEGVEGLAVGAAAGSSFQVELTVLCKDAKVAEEARKAIEAGLAAAKNDLPKDLADALGAVQLSTSGAHVTGKVPLKPGVLSKILK